VKVHRIAAAATMLTSAALSACSGTTGFTPPSPTPLPTSGPAYRYAGKMTQTYAYFYGYPSPEPPTTIRTKVQDAVTLSPATQYYLPAGTQDVHVNETDATVLQSTVTVTDAYVNTTSSKRVLYGSISEVKAARSAQSGHTTTTYVTPQILSESHGAWTNSPAASIDEKFADGHYQDRTIEADGTYHEKGSTYALNGKLAGIEIDERSTGAGNYAGPFLGCPPATSWVFSASPHITVTLYSTVSYCELAATPIPKWYLPSPTFYLERDRVEGSVTMPAECGSQAGKPARLTDRTISKLDTIIGYDEYTELSVFGSLSGAPVCIVLRDRIDNYYDWQADTPYTLLFTGNAKPVSTILTDQALVLVSGPSKGAAAVSPQAATAVAAGAQAHLFATLDIVRARLRDAMMRRLTTLVNRTGGTR
jgi:hypothetical protein